ncbi:MAG: hypothetical protein AAGK22_27700, partial [Acidobacteriota bacterium]
MRVWIGFALVAYCSVVVGAVALMEKYDWFVLLGPLVFCLVAAVMASPPAIVALGLVRSHRKGAGICVAASLAVLVSSSAVSLLIDSPRQAFVRKALQVEPGMSLADLEELMGGYQTRFQRPNVRSYYLSTSQQTI